jgi:hypothetical protein
MFEEMWLVERLLSSFTSTIQLFLATSDLLGGSMHLCFYCFFSYRSILYSTNTPGASCGWHSPIDVIALETKIESAWKLI